MSKSTKIALTRFGDYSDNLFSNVPVRSGDIGGLYAPCTSYRFACWIYARAPTHHGPECPHVSTQPEFSLQPILGSLQPILGWT